MTGVRRIAARVIASDLTLAFAASFFVVALGIAITLNTNARLNHLERPPVSKFVKALGQCLDDAPCRRQLLEIVRQAKADAHRRALAARRRRHAAAVVRARGGGSTSSPTGRRITTTAPPSGQRPPSQQGPRPSPRAPTPTPVVPPGSSPPPKPAPAPVLTVPAAVCELASPLIDVCR